MLLNALMLDKLRYHGGCRIQPNAEAPKEKRIGFTGYERRHEEICKELQKQKANADDAARTTGSLQPAPSQRSTKGKGKGKRGR